VCVCVCVRVCNASLLYRDRAGFPSTAVVYAGLTIGSVYEGQTTRCVS